MFFWWAHLAGSTVGFAVGSALLKRFADTSALPSLLLSFAVLGISNMLFVQVIRSGLGQGIIASSMSQILLISAFGVLVFDERLSAIQMAGIVMAVASIILILGFGSNPSAN